MFNKKSSHFIIIFLIVFFVFLSVFFCIYDNQNPGYINLFLLAIIKSTPIFLMIVLSFFTVDMDKKNKLFLIIGLSMSMISDATLVFNVIIGGLFSLFAMLFFTLSFFNHYSFKFLFFKNKKEIKKQSMHALYSGIISFFLFLIYSFIFIYPKTNYEFTLLNTMFPFYMIFLSTAVASSFFGKTALLTRIAIVLFFVSDSLLFYGFSFGFTPFLSFFNLIFYYSSQFMFVLKIND